MYRRFDHDTDTKLAFLSRPQSYCDESRTVECIETHMAWVFLTERHAFKMRKPVRYEFLDFSTVEARRRDCELEIELNKRLAADVYLDIVPLCADSGGKLHLGGDGEVLDWLVKMRRLPRERMLDWQLEHGSPTAEELRPAAELLSEFYRKADALEDESRAYPDDLRKTIRDNRVALRAPEYALSLDTIEEITRAQTTFLDTWSELVGQRVREGRIIEGHGDLRPEHISLSDPPVVIDCLEFNRQFRIVDPIDELAFLTVECGVLGQTWAGEHFLHVYSEVTGDEPAMQLFDFYKSMRALLRAKLSAWHLRDSEVRDGDKWLARAERYLSLASAFIMSASKE